MVRKTEFKENEIILHFGLIQQTVLVKLILEFCFVSIVICCLIQKKFKRVF